MDLVFEVPFAALAVVLSFVSWKTLQAIKNFNVGRSFWIPVFSSGILFFAGSIVAVLSDLGLPLGSYAPVVTSTSYLLALCSLSGGVYTYSRKITKNLAEKIILSAQIAEKKSDGENETNTTTTEQVLEENLVEEKIECKHQLGFLRTLPRRAPIPAECSGCHKIIECKFSLAKNALANSAVPPISKTSPRMMVSDIYLEEENTNGN